VGTARCAFAHPTNDEQSVSVLEYLRNV